MIIKRKLFTRQEQLAMKEVYQALKKGNIGRGLSAKKFVSARRAYNNTIDGLFTQNNSSGAVIDYAKNSQAIKDIGLPETAKAYKRMMEKYTNPELRERFMRIQNANSNSRLRIARQNIKNTNIDPLQARQDYYYDYHELPKNINPNEYKNTLKELERAKNERAGKSYKFNKKNIVSNSTNEDSEIASKHHQVIDLIKNNNQTDPESAQKIIKDLKKKGVKFTTKDPKSSYYAPEIDVINLKNKASFRNPLTISHEYGHRISDTRGELVGENFYRYNEGLNSFENTSNNLVESVRNRIGNMSTLMNEANASYHAAALANKYGIPKEVQKAGNKHLSNSFRTYELGAADEINLDNVRRLLGKYRNK